MTADSLQNDRNLVKFSFKSIFKINYQKTQSFEVLKHIFEIASRHHLEDMHTSN